MYEGYQITSDHGVIPRNDYLKILYWQQVHFECLSHRDLKQDWYWRFHDLPNGMMVRAFLKQIFSLGWNRPQGPYWSLWSWSILCEFEVFFVVINIPIVFNLLLRRPIGSFYKIHFIKFASGRQVHFREQAISFMAKEDIMMPALTVVPFIDTH